MLRVIWERLETHLAWRANDMAGRGMTNEVSGAESKIKGRRTPYGVTHCLHIFFGGAPWKTGGAPISALGRIGTDVSGGDPSKIPSIFAVWW